MEAGQAIDRRGPFGPAQPLIGQPMQRRRIVYYVQLMIADMVCLFLAFGGAALLTGVQALQETAGLPLLVLPLYPGIAFNAQAYSARSLERPETGIGRALSSLFYTSLIIFMALFLAKRSEYVSRVAFVVAALCAAFLIVIVRLLLGRHLLLANRGRFTDEILVLDSSNLPRPAGVICLDAAEYSLSPSLSDPHMLDRFARLVRGADKVVIACPRERRSAWSMILKGVNLRGNIIVPEVDELGGIGVDEFYEHRTIMVAGGPISMRDRARKRALDLAITIPAIIMLLPLLLMISVAIRIDSRGPVFFRQTRVGRDNALFQMLKFRSMFVEHLDDRGTASTRRGDDRITRIGRFLRTTSMDELPQLLNVLRGDMSVVGPRPHALGSKAGEQLFWEIDARYWHRHSAKPGITGLAQIRGYRGATAEKADLTNRLQADLDYLRNWSLSRDIRIILATLRVLVHRNAF